MGANYAAVTGYPECHLHHICNWSCICHCLCGFWTLQEVSGHACVCIYNYVFRIIIMSIYVCSVCVLCFCKRFRWIYKYLMRSINLNRSTYKEKVDIRLLCLCNIYCITVYKLPPPSPHRQYYHACCLIYTNWGPVCRHTMHVHTISRFTIQATYSPCMYSLIPCCLWSSSQDILLYNQCTWRVLQLNFFFPLCLTSCIQLQL